MTATNSPLTPLLSRVRTDITWKIIGKQPICTKFEPLTQERLEEHLNGNTSRGVCPIMAGQTTTRCALLDLDDHKGETPWPDMLQTAQNVMAALQKEGLHVIPWRSRGGKGVHLFMLWDDPQDAYSLRSFLAKILADLGYKNGTRGVINNEIEIFPKQDFVPPNGCGNMFILPLAGQSAPLLEDLCGDLYLGTRDDALQVVWKTSKPVPLSDKEAPHLRLESDIIYDVDLQKMREALKYIDPDESYDLWIKIGMAIHNETDGSPEGEALWDEWSAGDVGL